MAIDRLVVAQGSFCTLSFFYFIITEKKLKVTDLLIAGLMKDP